MLRTDTSAAADSMMMWILIVSGLLVAGIAGYAIFGPDDESGPKVLDICVEHSEGMSHFHPYLFIYINGNQVSIPDSVGVEEDCMRPLHTHDDSGKVHVELPPSKQMTLTVGDFFTVWGKDFSSTQLMNFEADEDNEIVMTVFPTKDDYEAGTNGVISGDYEKHVFSAKDSDGDGIPDGEGTVVLIEYKQKSN